MTLFKSEHRSPRYMSMTGELKTSRSKMGGVKRPSSALYGFEYGLDYNCYRGELSDRVYDYQCVPSALPALAKRPRSSNADGQRRSRDRPPPRSTRPHSSSRAKLRLEELQVIKRELGVIKLQVDGLLDRLDRMEHPRQNHTGPPLSPEGSLGASPSHLSVSSREVSPPSPRHLHPHRDATEPHTREQQNSDLEEEM